MEEVVKIQLLVQLALKSLSLVDQAQMALSDNVFPMWLEKYLLNYINSHWAYRERTSEWAAGPGAMERWAQAGVLSKDSEILELALMRHPSPRPPGFALFISCCIIILSY